MTCPCVFLLPYSLVYYIGDESGKDEDWKSSYVLDDFVLTVIYVPFAILWVIFLLIKKDWLKKILKFALVGLSILYFILAFLSLTMISPDVLPYFGVYVSILILPLLSVHLINSQKLNRIVDVQERPSPPSR